MEFLYTDRAERTLEQMLIWWGSLGRQDINGMRDLPYALQGNTGCFPRTDDVQIPVEFVDYSTGEPKATLMEPGDKLVFDPENRTMTLVR